MHVLRELSANCTNALAYGGVLHDKSAELVDFHAKLTQDERIRACYFHAVLKYLSGDKMKNASLCARLNIDPRNAAQASGVIGKTLKEGLIRYADSDHPRAGYVPHWA